MVLPPQYENYGTSLDDFDLPDRHEIDAPRMWPHKMVSLSTILASYPCDSEVAGNAMLKTYYGSVGEHRRDDDAIWPRGLAAYSSDFGGWWFRIGRGGDLERIWPR